MGAFLDGRGRGWRVRLGARRLGEVQGLNAAEGVAVTTFDLDGYVYDALHAGASGFLLKEVTGAGPRHRAPRRSLR
ncbi:hypothetical protein GCM10009718_16110 [Isoptericola halotolerans]